MWEWLQEDPDASAMALLGRLQANHPDRFSRANLRTLQRRVQQWRGIMANKLIYAASEATLRAQPDCQKWGWRRVIQSAEFSVTFFGEAIGIGKSG